jgi:hypothetical protein
MENPTKEARIDLELAKYRKQIAPNFSTIAELQQVNQTTLTRHIHST